MADEDEVDVLGDFCLNLDTELNNYDAGEFPSHGAGLLGDYMQHPWLMDHSQAWYFDHSTDEKNKASLDVMLEDEKKHFPTPLQVSSSPEPVPSVSSNAVMTTTSTPPKVSPIWTPADINLLKDGIKQYGQDWSKIARKIGTKTTLQVKSYVKIHPELVTSASRPCSRPGSRAPSPPNFVNEVEINAQDAGSSYSSLLLLDEAQIPASIEEVIASVTTGQPTVTKHKPKENVKAFRGKAPKKPPLLSPMSKRKPKKKPNAESEGCGIQYLPPSLPKIEPEAVVAPPLPKLEGEIIRIKKTSECDRPESEEEVDIDIEDEENPVIKASPVKREDPPVVLESPAEVSEVETIVEQNFLDEPELRETATADSSEESQPVFYFPAPTESRDIDPVTVTEEEKRVHWDFFEGKSSKTPERYIKIRNIIVQEWRRVKPRYLTKTSVRQYLKNCGDVNCISRIHAYLELTGVINFGCDKVSYDKPLPPVPSLRERFVPCPEKKLVTTSVDLPAARIRKKRQFSEDDKDGGYTIQHDADGNQIIVRKKKTEAAPKIRKPKKIKSPSEDPFQLVPYVSFDTEFTAPFEVQVSTQALVVIDVHAHLCTTEVIGLLGGHLYTTDNVPVLCIQAAQPCRSLSTGHQCEMCPVSQTEESERLRASGLEVVGWYHSHPTFPARPSLRDVHTQENFQNWFSKQEAPFIGVIINPYSGSKSGGPTSMIRCMTVYDGLPYKHELHFTSSFYDADKIEQILATLARDLEHCPTLVPLGSSYPHSFSDGDADTKITYGTKILSSLKNHLKDILSSGDIERLCAVVKERVTKVLSIKELV